MAIHSIASFHCTFVYCLPAFL